jgi:hypothetical protein
MTAYMDTLENFKTLALADVRSEVFGERLTHLFSHFTLADARDIVERTNRLPGDRDGVIEKGAVGAAVVAAAMHHYFGQYDGRGFFDFQYQYWGSHGIDAKYPSRTLDIFFLKPSTQATGGSITFQVEAKNYSNLTLSSLTSGNVAKQVEKDLGYLKTGPTRKVPLVPVWWFLQGLTADARHFLVAQKFRVIDFTCDPFKAELDRAFRVGP